MYASLINIFRVGKIANPDQKEEKNCMKIHSSSRLVGKGKLRSLQKQREPYIFKLLLFKRPFSSLSLENVRMSDLCNMRRNMQISWNAQENNILRNHAKKEENKEANQK